MKLPKRMTAAIAGIAMSFTAVAGAMADDTTPSTPSENTIETPTGFANGATLSVDDLTAVALTMEPVARGTNIVVMRNMMGQTKIAETGQTYLLRNDTNGHWATFTLNRQGDFTLTQQGYQSVNRLGSYNAIEVNNRASVADICSLSDDFREANITVFQGTTISGSTLNIWTPERINSKPVSGAWLVTEAISGDTPECKRQTGRNFEVATPHYLRNGARPQPI